MGTNNNNHKQHKNNVKNKKKLNNSNNNNYKEIISAENNSINLENNNNDINSNNNNNNNIQLENNVNNNNRFIKNKSNKLKNNKIVKFKIDDNSIMDSSGCSSNDESEIILKRVKETLKHEDEVEIMGTSNEIISNSSPINNGINNPLVRNNSGNNINEIISGGELSSEDYEHDDQEYYNKAENNIENHNIQQQEQEEEYVNNLTEEDDEGEYYQQNEEDETEDDSTQNYNNTSNDEREITEEDERYEKERIIKRYKLNKSSNRVLITNSFKNSSNNSPIKDNIDNSNNSNNNISSNNNNNLIDDKLKYLPDISSGGEYSSANSPIPTLKISNYDDKKRELGQHVDNKDVAKVVSESLNLESNNKQSSNKILEKKKSLDNLELNPFLKSLSEKRNNFIKKIVQKVWNTLKQATSDDLSTSQKDRIIQEVFKDISLEIDEPVFEYLTTLSDKDIEKVNYNLNNQQNQHQSNSPLFKSSSSSSLSTTPNSPLTFTVPTFKNSSKKDGILNNYYPYPCLDVAAKRFKLTPTGLNNSTSSTSTRVGLIHSSSSNSLNNVLNNSTSGSNNSHFISGSSGSKDHSLNEKEIYYYQLVSQYFLNNPDKVELFRPLLQSLWTNNQWFYLIYGSMFFSWLLEYRLSLTPQLNIFIKASNRLFWYDCDHYTRKYYQVYSTIKQKLLDRSLWNGLCEASKDSESSSTSNSNDPDVMRTNLLRNRRIWIDFYHIISIFYFYYEKSNDGLNEFRYNINRQYQDFILDTIQKKHISSESLNNDSNSNNNNNQIPETIGLSTTKELVLSIDDLFVRGVIKHLNLIKHEETLIGYIDRCLVFKDNWDLNPTTKVKLQSCLYALTKPGSPSYVPRSVRTKSREVLDQLFPNGKFSRHTVNLFFRLLHPYYSMGSIIHWGLDFIKSYIPFLNHNQNNNNKYINK